MQKDRIKFLEQDLEKLILKVTFLTKAGHYREMRCTRNLNLIPISDRTGIDNPKLNGPLIICAYDYQNSDWRAFRKDMVTAVELIE